MEDNFLGVMRFQVLDLMGREVALLTEESPSLYGDRVSAYPMAPPFGHNIDDERDWLDAERILSGLT